MTKNKSFLRFIIKILPKGYISRTFGHIAEIQLPSPLLNMIIDWYCNKYKVNRDEIDYPVNGFKTLDEFFTRRLKKGVHTIDESNNSIVSPVDSVIDQFGMIDGTILIQAKGKYYSLTELVPSKLSSEFVDGLFVSLYLSPSDFHRIQSPVTGKINGYLHIPGTLYTVQEFMTNSLDRLYIKNERLISFINTEWGIIAVCKIGALNVGRITLCYDESVSTNKLFRKRKEYFYNIDERPEIKKGEDLGVFHFGSTVILLFKKGMVQLEDFTKGKKIRVGERLATFIK